MDDQPDNPEDDPPVAAPDAGKSELEPLDEAAERRQGRLLTAIGVVSVGLLVAAVLGLTVFADSGDETGEVIEGTLVTPDGETVDLASLRGQPAVLNFFASWCAPCREELPAFQAVNDELGDRVTFVGINSGETDDEAARELLADTGVTFLVGLGDDGSILQEVGGTVMPTTALLDPDGHLVLKHPGDLTEEELTDLIEEHLLG